LESINKNKAHSNNGDNLKPWDIANKKTKDNNNNEKFEEIKLQ